MYLSLRRKSLSERDLDSLKLVFVVKFKFTYLKFSEQGRGRSGGWVVHLVINILVFNKDLSSIHFDGYFRLTIFFLICCTSLLLKCTEDTYVCY